MHLYLLHSNGVGRLEGQDQDVWFSWHIFLKIGSYFHSRENCDCCLPVPSFFFLNVFPPANAGIGKRFAHEENGRCVATSSDRMSLLVNYLCYRRSKGGSRLVGSQQKTMTTTMTTRRAREDASTTKRNKRVCVRERESVCVGGW